jgi:F-type H+-transporting ATPase subunit a
MLLIFIGVARGFKRNVGKAPKGIQSLFEPIIVYMRDEVIKPNIGHGYEKYVPYLLSLFFFIWFGNLFGLMPGSANLTGNIAVTATLAVFTFIITNVSGNANYWKHIFWTPGVPLPIRFIILPVEVIGLITKPISLMIRLFVAISAGHIVILSLIAMAFIFQSYAVGIGSSIVLVFINLIEILVATIQAYVFTIFTAVYIGLATEEAH